MEDPSRRLRTQVAFMTCSADDHLLAKLVTGSNRPKAEAATHDFIAAKRTVAIAEPRPQLYQWQQRPSFT